MAGRSSERLRWAVESVGVRATDHGLEVGCGHGVAVSLLCDRLGDGRVTALDRHLVPGGRLHVVFQPLVPSEVEPTVARLTGVYAGAGFEVVDVRVADLPAGRIARMAARPAPGSR